MKHLLLLALLLAVVLFASSGVRAEELAAADIATQDDEDDVNAMGGMDDAAVDADEAAVAGPGKGLTAAIIYAPYADLKVPAGEKVETLIAVHNAPSNPAYKAVFAVGHLSPMGDHSRFYQNFSGNAYDRALAPGATTTIKYSFTPDVNAEPQQFSLVVRLYVQLPDDENSTFMLTLDNTTITLEEPLGVDPKSIFTLVLFGSIGAGVAYYYAEKNKARGAKKGHRAAAVSAQHKTHEVGNVTVNPDYVSPALLKSLEAKRTRSTSN